MARPGLKEVLRTAQQEEAVHPLRKKKIDYIKSWKKCKELWEKATLVEDLHNLLHIGFEIETDGEERIERICLYLDIANGCFDHNTFEWSIPIRDGPGPSHLVRFGTKIEDIPHDLQEILSQKALQMLCQKFFKNTAEENHYPSWVRLAAGPQVLAKLIWFFRLDDEGRKLFNLGYSSNWCEIGKNNMEIAATFAEEFSLLTWKCKEEKFRDRLYNGEAEAFWQVRPSMIEILFGLRKLDALFSNERYKRIDKECMNKIEYLALAFKLNFSILEKRKPESIKEACLVSQAARVLLSLRVMQQEDTRLEKLDAAKEKIREGQEEVKNLKPR